MNEQLGAISHSSRLKPHIPNGHSNSGNNNQQIFVRSQEQNFGLVWLFNGQKPKNLTYTASTAHLKILILAHTGNSLPDTHGNAGHVLENKMRYKKLRY